MPTGLCRSGITVAAGISPVSDTGSSMFGADSPLLMPSCSFDIQRTYCGSAYLGPPNADAAGVAKGATVRAVG
jgi:hypothetical protein